MHGPGEVDRHATGQAADPRGGRRADRPGSDQHFPVRDGRDDAGHECLPRAGEALYVSFEELWDAVDGNGAGPLPKIQAGWWSNYEALEQSAVSIRTWEPMVVPGLLQTEGYAKTLLQDDELVARRIARQAIVSRNERPVSLTAILDEAVLHRPIGGSDVLAGQLRQLVTTLERPNVTIQVLPLTAEAKAVAIGGKGAFVILEPSWPGGLVHMEHTGGSRSLDARHELEAHIEAFDRLRELALAPAESEDCIRRRWEELEQ